MNESWGILNGSFLWPALAAAAFLLVVFALKEWAGQRGLPFFRRLIFALLAIGALLGLALKPALRQELVQGKALLLTPGYENGVADSLKRIYPRIQTLEYRPGKALDMDASLTSLLVVGHGLASYDLWQLEGREAVFLPASPPDGISRLRSTREVELGMSLVIDGAYRNAVRGHRLLLRDPGGNPRDSAVMPAVSHWSFRLATAPKASGNLTYYLEEQDSSGQLIRTDPIPVVVQSPQPMRVLILNTFPTFETRYLKNLLGDKGNEVVVRSQLTRGAYKFEYINSDPKPVYRLTEEGLGEFDLLIADAPSYRSLEPSSRGALRKSVEERGLGLLIQADDRFLSRPSDQPYFYFRPDGRTDWESGSRDKMVLEKYPYAFSMEFPVEPVLLPNGKQVGATRPVGRGRVVTTLLKDTYQWVLHGKEGAYRELWAALLRQAAGRHEDPIKWESRTGLPRRDAPFEFKLRGSLSNQELVNEQGLRLPLLQDLLIPTLWKGQDYPEHTGWNRLRFTSDSLPEFPYYVYGERDWETLETEGTRKANTLFFEGASTSQTTAKGLVPVSPWWFFALFLAAMGWLWLEPRLKGN